MFQLIFKYTFIIIELVWICDFCTLELLGVILIKKKLSYRCCYISFFKFPAKRVYWSYIYSNKFILRVCWTEHLFSNYSPQTIYILLMKEVRFYCIMDFCHKRRFYFRVTQSLFILDYGIFSTYKLKNGIEEQKLINLIKYVRSF